jgi:hypothetical protein
MESTNNEIDLQDLAIRLILYFKRHFLFIAISTFAGILLSISIYVKSPNIFESRMIVMSDILTESYSKEITESLKKLIKENNYNALAFRLGLNETEAEKIKSIEIISVKKDKESDKAADNTIFIVTARIKDKDILPRLQNGIVQFLRNNEFVKIRVRQRREMYQSLIEKIQLEISSLDSLKRRLFLGKPVYAKSSEMLLVDPTSIYSKIIELNKEKINYKNSFELADSIQLVEGFTIFQKPVEPKLSILLLMGFFGGSLVSIGLLIFIQLLRLANSKLL